MESLGLSYARKPLTVPLLIFLLDCLLVIVPALISVAFITLLERKVLSLVGFRLGPNKVSFSGILQPIGDAVKLANKSVNSLFNFSYFFYYMSSFSMLIMGVASLCVVFNYPLLVNLKFCLLIFFFLLSINSLNSIVSGWSCFSKYSLIGSVRTLSQLVSYEVVLYMCIFFPVLIFNSFDFSSSNFNSFVLTAFMIPCFYIWVPTFLAELNRTPYDFSEGESELVSGYNTEFGSDCFTLIFLAEYASIFFFCILGCALFFNFSFLSFILFVLGVIWFRSVLPRYRFDKLMMLSWKFFVPFITFYFGLFFIKLV